MMKPLPLIVGILAVAGVCMAQMQPEIMKTSKAVPKVDRGGGFQRAGGDGRK